MLGWMQLSLLVLLAVQACHAIGDPGDDGPDDDLTVVSFSMGEENEDIDDSTKEWFTGIYDVNMITMVRIEYYKYNGLKRIRCIGFSYGTPENNCPSEPEGPNQIDDIVLERDEYITEVSGDAILAVLSIYFKTNKGSIGPYGMETDVDKHTFHASNEGKPLLYVKGYKGMWVYSMHFSFHYKGVLELKQKLDDVANRTYTSLKGPVGNVFKINNDYRRMLPDLAKIGCYFYDDDPSTEGALEACDLQVLLNQLNILATASANLKRHAPRNLLHLKDYDSSKYLEVVNNAKSFHDLLTTIRFDIATVIDVTYEQSEQLNDYFSTIADFDKKIAEQDLAYIQGVIEEKKTGADAASAIIKTRLDRIFGVAVSCAATEVIDKAFQLGSIIASQMNPIKLLFSGPDMGDIFDALDELYEAIGNLVEIATLMALVDDFLDLFVDIAEGFAENAEQMIAMEQMLEILANETDPEMIHKHSEAFIKLYGDYSPQVSSQQIVYAITLLDAMANEGCDLLSGLSGMCSTVVGPIFNSVTQDCVYIAADIASLNSYFEDTYSLQFEMIDVMTSIVRGFIALEMGGRLGSIQNTLDLSTAAVGTAMLETSYQAASLARCDILEYLQAGKRPDICKKLLFLSEDIQALISYTGSASTSERKVFAFIPTTPQQSMDIPFVNLTKILRGEKQMIRLPIGNKAWLRKHYWIPQTDNPESAFVVSAFEMYIPALKCNESASATRQIAVEAVSANPTKLYAESAPPSYTTDKHLVVFEYMEPALWCADDLINIPVANNDDMVVGHTATVCPYSRGEITPPNKDDFTFPSLFTTWTINVISSNDCTLVEDEDFLNFQPMITVRAEITQVFVKKEPGDPGIDSCWPENSRCEEGERCVDLELDFKCEPSPRARLMRLIHQMGHCKSNCML